MSKKLKITKRIVFANQNLFQLNFGKIDFKGKNEIIRPLTEYDAFRQYSDIFRIEIVDTKKRADTKLKSIHVSEVDLDEVDELEEILPEAVVTEEATVKEEVQEVQAEELEPEEVTLEEQAEDKVEEVKEETEVETPKVDLEKHADAKAKPKRSRTKK